MYCYEGEGERGTHKLLMAASEHDWRRVEFHGTTPKMRGLLDLDHNIDVASEQCTWILYVLLTAVVSGYLGYVFCTNREDMPFYTIEISSSPPPFPFCFEQVVGSDLAFLALMLL